MFLTEIVNLVNAGYGQSHEFINDKTRGERGGNAFEEVPGTD